MPSVETGMPAEKTKPTEVPVDMEKCLRLTGKVTTLLQKKTRNPMEAYVVVHLVSIFMEENFGIRLAPNQEEELRKSMREMRKVKNESLVSGDSGNPG